MSCPGLRKKRRCQVRSAVPARRARPRTDQGCAARGAAGAAAPKPPAARAAGRCRRTGGCPPPAAKPRRGHSGDWPGVVIVVFVPVVACAGQRAGRHRGRQTRPGCGQVPGAGEPHRSGGRGNCQRAGRSAGAQPGSGQVTPPENCHPSSAAQPGQSPRDHARLRQALATACRRTAGAGDGAIEVRHVPQPDGDGFPRAGQAA
jgi:hypothetical protein